jgi:replicative DNA helicase
MARDVRPEIVEYSKMNEGEKNLFNLAWGLGAGQEAGYIFVVEGEIDCLSLWECGYHNSIGLGGVGNYVKLINALKEIDYKGGVLIALDNDKAGKENALRMKEELQELSIECVICDFYGKHKDSNEYLVADRQGLEKALAECVEDFNNALREEEERRKTEYMGRYNVSMFMDNFLDSMAVNTPCIPSGIDKLDRYLGGGFYEGLYCLGAIPSAGKTTLMLQIADNIAKNGNDVIVISMEMSRNELIAKSISRLTAIMSHEKAQDVQKYAKTVRGITNRSLWDKYSGEEVSGIVDSMNRYTNEIAGNMYIVEGVGNVGVQEIKEIVAEHISITKKKPIVFIDYLQILEPPNDKASDKKLCTENERKNSRLRKNGDGKH